MFCPVFKQTLKQVRANQKIHVSNSPSENFQKLKKHWSSAFQISANTEYKLHVANNTVLGSKVVCCAYHNNEILTQMIDLLVSTLISMEFKDFEV